MNDYFSGSINGHNVNDLYSKIDYSKSGLEDRVDICEDIINTGFFDVYFEDYHNPIRNKNDSLSEHNNICRLLENMANYILGSDESLEMDKQEEYDYLNSKYLIRKINKDSSLNSIVESSGLPDVALDNMIRSDVSKIAKNKAIKFDSNQPKDIINDIKIDKETKEIVLQYMDYYDRLGDSKQGKQKVDRIKGGVAKDIETLIESCYKDIQHNNLKSNSSDRYYTEGYDVSQRHILSGVSFYNTNGVIEKEKGLLFMNKDDGLDIGDELNIILNDLEDVIHKSNLTKRESQVLKLLREGYQMKDIAVKVGCSINTITADRKRIVEKVLNKLQKNT